MKIFEWCRLCRDGTPFYLPPTMTHFREPVGFRRVIASGGGPWVYNSARRTALPGPP